MTDRSREQARIMDGAAPCVAMIERGEGGALAVRACNDAFLRMTGATGTAGTTDEAPQTFPIAFDALGADAALQPLRTKLLACLASEAARQTEHTYDFRDAIQWWRLALKPIRHAGDAAAVSGILLTGFELAAPPEPAQAQAQAPARAPDAPQPEVGTLRYRALVDLAYDAIVTMDQQHNITLFNRAAENLFGYTSDEVLGRCIEMLLPERFRANHSRNVQQFADSYQTTLRQATPPRMDDSNSVYGQHRDGSVIPVEIAVSKIDVNGATEFTAVVRDITDRARLMELLKKQATTDALTGLPNRREFLEFVERVLGTRAGLSVFILDIDFFKEINDSHGHDAGDEVLRALARVGAEMTPGQHLFARWGGEEFVAALPGADESRAHTIADRLRQRFEQQDFVYAWPREPIPFTVSIGVVTRVADETDVEALMKRADRALYRAKGAGRNRVEAG